MNCTPGRAPRQPALPDPDGGGGAGTVDERGDVLGGQVNEVHFL